MSKSLSIVNTAIDTFGSWVDKVNAIVTFANTEVVSANSSGALTIGTGFVQGKFGSNTVSANVISGGNTTSSANLAISTNAIFQQTAVANVGFLVGNTGVSSINAFGYASTNTDPQPLDAFPVASYRGGKYVLSITDPGAGRYQVTEILVMHDGNTAYVTEYATLTSNGQVASFSADVNAGNCRVIVTPNTAVVQINTQRVLNSV